MTFCIPVQQWSERMEGRGSQGGAAGAQVGPGPGGGDQEVTIWLYLFLGGLKRLLTPLSLSVLICTMGETSQITKGFWVNIHGGVNAWEIGFLPGPSLVCRKCVQRPKVGFVDRLLPFLFSFPQAE